MPRSIIVATIASFFLVANSRESDSQVATCHLAPRPYGFGGLCRPQQAEGGSSGPLRIRLPDSVRVWSTEGPQDRPPWRGNISLPNTEVAFEIAPGSTAWSRSQLVFRTGVFWLPVKEWRQVDSAPPPCAACERLAKDVLLVLDLVNPPSATEDDLIILRSALVGGAKIARGNRQG